MEKDKHKKLIETIRSIWSSLESHLDYTYLKSSEGKKFHKQCVKDYANDIKNLSELF